jgi:ketosteroid isomerase-like protein
MTSRSCVRESFWWRHKSLPVSGTKDTSALKLLQKAYAAFNARDLDGALATMNPDVVWPNGMEGGTVHGHEGVRAYWTRQWGMIDPHVDPVGFRKDEDGRIAVSVHQVVRDLSGNVLLDRMVEHVYILRDGLIQSMDIRE